MPGVAGADSTAVAGSIATAVIAGTVHAYITDSTVDADRNLTLLAEQDGGIESYGGALAISTEASGLGGAISINVLTNDVPFCHTMTGLPSSIVAANLEIRLKAGSSSV